MALSQDADPGAVLDHILELGDEVPADQVGFMGSDPVLRTTLRIGELGAAAIAAAAVGAARTWELRGGRPQAIAVEVDRAAAGMRSYRYVRDEPQIGPVPRSQAVPDKYFPTRSGRFMYLQRLFPHHIARQLEVLGCAADAGDEETAAAIYEWDPFALEEAVIAAGATGAAVRTHEEWAAHEQGKAVAAVPLFEIVKISDSDPEPFPISPRPLAGVRVLDVTRVLAGPTCGRTLAEHGADVLRVGTSAPPDNPVMMKDLGFGKRSTELDLKTSSGRDAFVHLLEGADVVSQGYRPGALDAVGLSPEEAARRRPGIIYVSESAFSHVGPWAQRRGFDSVVQAASGIADELTDPGTGYPRGNPATALDYTTGYLATYATTVALRRRAREGGSYLVRLSLAQTARLLVSLTRVDPVALSAVGDELSSDRLDTFMTVSDTPFGRLRHFAPIAQLEVTPGRFDHPTVPLDHDPPTWW